MGDIADMADGEVDAFLADSLAKHRATQDDTPSDGTCVDCGDEIPEKRLEHFPNAQRCVECQGFKEREDRRNL